MSRTSKIYYESNGLAVRGHNVAVHDNRYPMADIGPVRTIRRNRSKQSFVDVSNRAGAVLETVMFRGDALSGAMTFASAINQAVADRDHSTVIQPYIENPGERGACGWILMIAGGIVAAVVILWLLFVIF